MIQFLIIFLLVVSSISLILDGSEYNTITVETATPDGGTETYEREFLVYVPEFLRNDPPSFLNSISVSLVFALHGGGSNGKGMFGYSGFKDVSEKYTSNTFVSVYPSGVDGKFVYGDSAGVRDVVFFEKIIDLLAGKNIISNVRVDRNRIFMTGFSNGGMACCWFIQNSAYQINGIAPTGGSTSTWSSVVPKTKNNFLLVYGLDDGYYSEEKMTRNVEYWIKSNECEPETIEESLTSTDTDCDGYFIRKRYTNCKEEKIWTLEVKEMGHSLSYSQTIADHCNGNGFVGSSTTYGELIWELFQDLDPIGLSDDPASIATTIILTATVGVTSIVFLLIFISVIVLISTGTIGKLFTTLKKGNKKKGKGKKTKK